MGEEAGGLIRYYISRIRRHQAELLGIELEEKEAETLIPP